MPHAEAILHRGWKRSARLTWLMTRSARWWNHFVDPYGFITFPYNTDILCHWCSRGCCVVRLHGETLRWLLWDIRWGRPRSGLNINQQLRQFNLVSLFNILFLGGGGGGESVFSADARSIWRCSDTSWRRNLRIIQTFLNDGFTLTCCDDSPCA